MNFDDTFGGEWSLSNTENPGAGIKAAWRKEREKRMIRLGWLRGGCRDNTGISLELINYTLNI